MADPNPSDQPIPAEEAGTVPYIRPGAPGTAADTVSASRYSTKPKVAEKPPEIKDPWREIIETIVFVVVLVFMLKTFLAEAFVIPTGSMATTLLGYHRDVVCTQCAYEYPVNASNEVEPQDGPPVPVTKSDCPNCGYRNPIRGR